MKKIETKNAPIPIGPYSQAIEANGFIFFSGQIALDLNNNLINKDIQKETFQILRNIEAILNDNQLKKEDIVKTSIFLTDINDFEKVNKIYETFLGKHKPARSTVAVLALPLNAKIEIEVIAQKEKA